ncbi:hypothetical protein [Aquibium oceanicum]
MLTVITQMLVFASFGLHTTLAEDDNWINLHRGVDRHLGA